MNHEPDAEASAAESTFASIPVYNLIPHPGQAGLVGFFAPAPGLAGIHGDQRADRERLRPRRSSVTGIYPLLGGLAYSNRISGAFPADPIHDTLRIAPRRLPSRFDNLFEAVLRRNPLEPPAGSRSSSNPTTCGAPLGSRAQRSSPTTGSRPRQRHHIRRLPVAISSASTRACSRSRRRRRTDTASGLDVDLQVPQRESPIAPSPSEIRASTVDASAEGFSINPNAADGRSPAPTQRRTSASDRKRRNARRTSKVGTLTLESSALPGPMPGYIYLGDPEPGERYRICARRRRLQRPRQARRARRSRTRRPGSSRSASRISRSPRSPTSTCTSSAPNEDCWRPRTSCGTYAVNSTFTPVGRGAARPGLDPVLLARHGPGRSSLPDRCRALQPDASPPASPTRRRGTALAVHRSTLNRDRTATRTSPRSRSRRRPASARPWTASPTARRRRSRGSAAPAYTGLAEQATPDLPGREPGRHRRLAGVGAGTHPLYVPGKVYLAGPYKGAPLSLAVVTPAVSGPYDLGNVVDPGRAPRRPDSAQVTAVSDPLPQILDGDPVATRSILAQPRPARISPSTRPTAIRSRSTSTISGDQGAAAQPLDPTSRSPTARDLAFGPKLALRLSGGMKRTGNPALHAVLTAKPGRSEHLDAPR